MCSETNAPMTCVPYTYIALWAHVHIKFCFVFSLLNFLLRLTLKNASAKGVSVDIFDSAHVHKRFFFNILLNIIMYSVISIFNAQFLYVAAVQEWFTMKTYQKTKKLKTKTKKECVWDRQTKEKKISQVQIHE